MYRLMVVALTCLANGGLRAGRGFRSDRQRPDWQSAQGFSRDLVFFRQ